MKVTVAKLARQNGHFVKVGDVGDLIEQSKGGLITARFPDVLIMGTCPPGLRPVVLSFRPDEVTVYSRELSVT